MPNRGVAAAVVWGLDLPELGAYLAFVAALLAWQERIADAAMILLRLRLLFECRPSRP